MSALTDALTRQAGPLPVGVWIGVGVGGLVLAWRTRGDDEPQLTREVQQVPVPVGAIAAVDQAPVVITPIIRLPDVLPAPLPGGSGPSATPPAGPSGGVPTTVLRPGGVVSKANVNPNPYPTVPPPNGAQIVPEGSGQEWVTKGSIPGVTGWVWNRNSGTWQPR